MNILFKMRKDMVASTLAPLRYLIYFTLLSKVTTFEDGDEKSGVFDGDTEDVYDIFSEWSEDEVYEALNALGDEGLIFFDDEDDRIYLGEFRGRRFFTYEQENSLYDSAKELLDRELHRYGKSKSAKDRSRARFIVSQIDSMLVNGIDKVTPGQFTELHGYLYELYTGGETYIVRNKVEYYQTTNMLKAYDKHTVFAILVEGTLHYDNYRKSGIPTLTNVAVIKDDVFRGLSKKDSESKEYMRDVKSSMDESDF